MKNEPKTTLIKDGQSLDSATGIFGYPIKTYDDGFGPLWVYRDSMGVSGIVRAKTWEDAYSICEDEFMSEASETLDEIIKEYGFTCEHKKVVKDSSVLVSTDHTQVGERFATNEDYPASNGGKLLPEFIRWETIETPNPEAWMDNECFQEGFGFRPNGPNVRDTHKHGIYARDLNGESLDMLTSELIEAIGIVLVITGEVNEDED
jgi:hypothetical protein